MKNSINKKLCENIRLDPGVPNGLVWEGNNHYKTPDGNPCGCLNKRGYYQTYIKGKIYLNHRLVFFLANGYVPEFVDHIDTDTTNNSPENLRESTKSQNQCNHSIRKDNTLGIKGLCYDKRRAENPWFGQVGKFGKVYSTKRVSKKEEAILLLKELRETLHKEFTNHGE